MTPASFQTTHASRKQGKVCSPLLLHDDDDDDDDDDDMMTIIILIIIMRRIIIITKIKVRYHNLEEPF
jgi:hypothetical protein